jgi:hypothetical protein
MSDSRSYPKPRWQGPGRPSEDEDLFINRLSDAVVKFHNDGCLVVCFGCRQVLTTDWGWLMLPTIPRRTEDGYRMFGLVGPGHVSCLNEYRDRIPEPANVG